MAASRGEFEELPDDEFSMPLPPEDRLWRHPSELGSANHSLPLDAVAVRRRWLSQQPSRASAWTAGLVGAILATGLVALGTHLAGAFTSRSTPSGDTVSPPATAAATESPAPRSGGLGLQLAASITRVGASVAAIEVIRGGVDSHFLGLVVRADGMVLAPAVALEGASVIEVTLAGSVPAVASLVAADGASGLAVLHVNGSIGLPALQLDTGAPFDQQSLALVVTSSGGGNYVLGSLEGLDATASVGGTLLTDVLRTDVPAAKAPPGSALIDAAGDVVGMVAGAENGTAVAVPSWVAGPVVDQLLASGIVHHGLFGAEGRTVAQKGFQPAGVLLTEVTPGSAAGVAGLRVGDIITSVNFQRVTSLVGLRGHLYGLAAGQVVLIGIDRGTTDLFYRVYLQDAPAASHAA